MKFSEAWANIVKQNQHLKISLAASVLTSIILVICTIHFSMKDPLIFERGCITRTAKTGASQQTDSEYKEFIEKVLKQRFDTNEKVIEGFLSIKEKKNKIKEQLVLKKNSILQFILLRNFSLKEDVFLIEADRLYSVNQIRSTISVKLKVFLKTKARTETNPYGLILDRTEELKEDKGVKNDKK